MSEALKRKIGARIKTARQRAGLSQDELAASAQRTPESISNIERGQQLPSLDTLAVLIAVLQLPLSDILADMVDKRELSPERLRNEARIHELVRELSDSGVAIAAQQMEALRAVS